MRVDKGVCQRLGKVILLRFGFVVLFDFGNDEVFGLLEVDFGLKLKVFLFQFLDVDVVLLFYWPFFEKSLHFCNF